MAPYNNFLSLAARYEQLLQNLSKPVETYNRIFERMSQIGEQYLKFSNSVMFASASIVHCIDTLEQMREGLVTKLIPQIEHLQALQEMVSLLDTTLPEFLDIPATPEVIEEPECPSVAVSEGITNKRFTVQDVIAILSLLFTMLGMLTSAIDSRRTDALQQKELQIMEEELRLMEEQRDHVALLCEELLTILDDSESNPSPAPTPESTPPMSDTAEISVPVESEVAPDTGSASDDIFDGQSKNSETN